MQPYILPDQKKVRDTILDRLRKATAGRPVRKAERPAGSFVVIPDGPLTEAFSLALRNVSGNAYQCNSKNELADILRRLAEEAGWSKMVCPDTKIAGLLQSSSSDIIFEDKLSVETEVVITGCEALIADIGSVLVSTSHTRSRRAFVYGPAHVVIASENQIRMTLDEAMSELFQRYQDDLPSMISVITGPSRTADIEKTLILGAHGPKALHVIITKQDL